MAALLVGIGLGVPVGAWAASNILTTNFIQSMSVLEVIGSIGLSAILAYLYLDMRDIQENQEELMKVQYEPEIKVTISSGSDGFPVVLVRNTGFAAALDVDIELRIGDKERVGNHPFLGSDDSIEYPVYSSGEPSTAEEIMERVNFDAKSESDGPFTRDIEALDDTLVCSIECEDVKGSPHTFDESFDIERSLDQLEDFKIRTEVDALEDIDSRLERIEEEIREMNNDLLK